MRQLKQIVPALLAAMAMTACGGGDNNENKDPSNTPNNESNQPNNENNMSNTTDMCADVTCDPPAAACVGMIAVTYSGAGTCDSSDGTCDYTTVEDRTDCAANGQNCMGGACVDIDDLCATVTCDTPPMATCEGAEAVSFGGGTCNSATGMCDYVESRTDCVANAQICSMGACIEPGPNPNPGELVISEVMPNPAAVGDGEGEWFEIFNATARDLDLNGLLIIDDGGDSFAIPDATAMLPAGEYLVFGINADTGTNGGVDVDIEYTGINLANGDDELVILAANDAEIDRVAWNDTMGWLIPAGSSIQFGAENDLAADDNNDPQFWCPGVTAYGDGDFGTPGAANDMCPQPVTVTLYELSDEANANYPGVNSPVVVNGVAITALDATEGYVWLQETAGGQFSGIYVDAGTVDVSALAVGDVIDIEGVYDEWNGLARITATAITDTTNDMMAVPEVLESSVFADAGTAEPWENVLVQVNEAGVTDVDDGAQFGEVLVDSNVIVDDLLFDGFTGATECEVYEFVVGPLNYSFGSFKIEPRDAADIGAATMGTLASAVSVMNFAFTPPVICVTAGQDVTWTNSDTTQHTVTSRLPSQDSALNANIPTTPLFDETLLLAVGTATINFPNAGSFHYRCRPHAAMEGVVVVPDP